MADNISFQSDNCFITALNYFFSVETFTENHSPITVLHFVHSVKTIKILSINKENYHITTILISKKTSTPIALTGMNSMLTRIAPEKTKNQHYFRKQRMVSACRPLQTCVTNKLGAECKHLLNHISCCRRQAHTTPES